jgi:hypothetical protein
MNKRVIIVMAVILGIVMLGGAAYVGVNLIMSGRAGLHVAVAPPGGGGLTLMKNGQRVAIQLSPAPELPHSPADIHGKLVSMKDNSLNVSTAPQDPGAPTPDPATVATTEVVVTQNTKIYRDATFDAMQPPPPDGKIQQKVEPYTLAQAEKDGMDAVTAWGTRRGDRLLADVVVLTHNVMIVRKTGAP